MSLVKAQKQSEQPLTSCPSTITSSSFVVLIVTVALLLIFANDDKAHVAQSQRRLYGFKTVGATIDNAEIALYKLSNGFDVVVDRRNHHVELQYNQNIVWRGCPGCFVQAAVGQVTIEEERGSFDVQDKISKRTDYATISSVAFTTSSGTASTASSSSVTIQGDLWIGQDWLWGLWKRQPKQAVSYQLVLSVPTEAAAKTTQVGFDLSLLQQQSQDNDNLEYYNRVYLSTISNNDEVFFGMGTQFTHLQLNGREFTILSEENGILRGKPSLANAILSMVGVNGRADSSYAPVPYYMTNRGRGFFLENYDVSVFDMASTQSDMVVVKLLDNHMKGRWIYSSNHNPLDILESYTEYTGRMTPLPDWINQGGAIVGMQGGTDEVLKVHEQLQALETPVAAFWLQDWVGKRQTCFGSQLWWNWQLNTQQYPNWSNLKATLQDQDTRVMLYVSPYMVQLPPDHPLSGQGLYEIGVQNGYFVMGESDSNQPYQIGNTDFSAAVLDLSNPQAREWMKQIIIQNLIGIGASGWMADYGEGLPMEDIVLHSGQSSQSYHNEYPQEWARLNQEAIAEANRTGDIVFFARSGFTKSPGYATLFWEGDQMVTWDEYDGMKSAIIGLLSSGMSAFSLNHNDIGGYTSISYPPLVDITRSRELLMRWIEMNAFTAVFRTHEGLRPEDGAQFYTDSQTLAHFSKFAKVYTSLATYRKTLMEEAATKGYPVVRHLFLHYPNDPVTRSLEYQWMLGADFLVAPVTEKGQQIVNVYLPGKKEGKSITWTHIWTQQQYTGGSWHQVNAPMGEPAVFFVTGSEAGETFLENLRAWSVVLGSR